MGYKIITIEEAEILDFETVEQTNLESARKNIDGSKVLISSDEINDMNLKKCLTIMATEEWSFENDIY